MMRRFLIDTDCASDDAVAIIMALKSKEIKIEAITTVCGNVSLNMATRNALMSIEVAKGQTPPLYVGCEKPLVKDLVMSSHIHGKDGMSDLNLINTTITPEKEHAIDAIIEIVSKHPNEIEIIALGPVTNIAKAIMKNPAVMKKVKHIYSMGTAGFGKGNITPVAEFNVYVDAEAYDIMLKAEIATTIIGFDMCLHEAALNKAEVDILLSSGNEAAIFAVNCNKCVLEHSFKHSGDYLIALPDAIAMGVALWDDLMTVSLQCFCNTCTTDPVAYGQVVVDAASLNSFCDIAQSKKGLALVCKEINTKMFKDRLLKALLS